MFFLRSHRLLLLCWRRRILVNRRRIAREWPGNIYALSLVNITATAHTLTLGSCNGMSWMCFVEIRVSLLTQGFWCFVVGLALS
jgi:hypothetical protein